MPAEGTAVLENLAFDLAREASELSAQLHPVVRLSVADLVRSMNCYYSNLIEGHNTHPRDIDRALAADYSSDPHRRDLRQQPRRDDQCVNRTAPDQQHRDHNHLRHGHHDAGQPRRAQRRADFPATQVAKRRVQRRRDDPSPVIRTRARTPNCPISAASERMTAATALFEPAYSALPGSP